MMLFKSCTGKTFTTIIIATFWLFAGISATMAQKQHIQIPAFEAKGESLSSVLQRLAEQGNINLTYNASDSAFSQPVSFQTKAQTAPEILTALLDQIAFEYQQVGNHMVILKTNTRFQESPFQATAEKTKQTVQGASSSPITPALKADTIIKTVEVPVYIVDTLIIKDTIIREKELIVRDTIYINSTNRGKRRINLSDNVFGNTSSDESGWHLQLSITNALLGYHTIAEDAVPISDSIRSLEPLSLFSPGLGIGLKYKTSQLAWLIGLELQHTMHRFNYEKIRRSGGVYARDTIDVFYTVIQTDTVWTYVTDSTWLPLNQSMTSYDQRNQILMLSVKGNMRYNYLQTRDFDLFIQVGGAITTPLMARGKTILNEENYPVVDLSTKNLNSLVWSYQVGTGITVRLDQGFGFTASLNYMRQLSSLYKNYPSDRRLNGLLIDISMTYKL